MAKLLALILALGVAPHRQQQILHRRLKRLARARLAPCDKRPHFHSHAGCLGVARHLRLLCLHEGVLRQQRHERVAVRRKRALVQTAAVQAVATSA